MPDIEPLAEATLVVAHPDDEILWFSSIVEQLGKIIICYLDVPEQDEWTKGRAEAARQFPLGNTEFLGLVESVAFKQANWADPLPSPFGLELDVSQREMPPLPGFSASRYRQNYLLLLERLRPLLSGSSRVFTHNPWGEYGHEEHVQVYRAVSELRRELNYEVWFDTYASDRSAVLMARSITRTQYQHVSLPTRPEVAARIEALYRRTDCWTWPYDDYRWFEYDTFACDPEELPMHQQAGSRLPVNFINVDFSAWQTPKRSLIQRLRRRIRRLRRTL